MVWILIRIQDSDQGHLRDVQAFTQQVDAYQHVEDAHTKVADDLHSFQSIHVGVQVTYPDVYALQVVRQGFSHLLGEGGDQHLFALGRGGFDLADQVVDLTLGGLYVDGRVEKTCWSDQLLGVDATGYALLVFSRSSRKEHHLVYHLFPLLEFQRTVVQG